MKANDRPVCRAIIAHDWILSLPTSTQLPPERRHLGAILPAHLGHRHRWPPE
jgi:hypothetical protein